MVTYASNLNRLADNERRHLQWAKRRVARKLAPPRAGLENRQPDLTRRWATVKTVNGDGTVDLLIDKTTIRAITVLASYAPAVNDSVILDFLGSDPVVIGAAGQAARAGGGIPPGAMLDFGGGTAPAGYLLCDGSLISRTTYAALFAAVGTGWGAGDGSTTFGLPDFRGRVAVAAGTGSGLTARTIGQTGGEEAHPLTAAEGAVHSHTKAGDGSDFVHTVATSSQYLTGTAGGQAVTWGNGTNNAGSGTAHNTMQPFAVVTKIIKT